METKRKHEPENGATSPKRVRLDSSSAVMSMRRDPGTTELPQTARFIKSEIQRCPSEDRNIFSELEKMQPSTKPVTEVCYMPQAVPSLTPETSTYVENNIQPSPKDSGIDVSSPDRKFEDLGDLSSQESSPRVSDPTLRLDTGKDIHKGKPKYAAIGNITQSEYLTNSVKGYNVVESLDSNMNNSKTVTSNSPCITDRCLDQESAVCGRDYTLSRPASRLTMDSPRDQDGHRYGDIGDMTEEALMMPGDVSDPGTTEHSHSQCSRTDRYRSVPEESTTSRHLSSHDLGDGEGGEDPVEILCNNDCTLAELNMSQKSTEVDLPSLLDTELEASSQRSEFADDDSSIGVFEVGDGLEDNIFSPLNEDSVCSFSVSGTPNKKLYLTPKSTPSRQVSVKPTTSSSSSSSSSSVSKTHTKHEASVSTTGFLSEFTKFLQQARNDDVCSEDDDESFNNVDPFIKKPANKSQSLVKSTNSQEKQLKRENKRTESPSVACVCCSSSHKPVKHVRVNATRFVKSQKKVHSLRLKVVRLLHVLFPDLDYPCRNARTVNTVDFLLDQITCSVRDQRHCHRKAEVIPSGAPGVMDVRVIVCKAPLGCLRQLRRKVCHFLETVLPDLNLGRPFDRTGMDVENLVQEVIRCNTS